MKIGISKEMITPHIHMNMGGYAARQDPFEGIHDDLYVRVWALRSNRNLLIISFDLIQYRYTLNEQIMRYAFETYGIEKEQIVISYSHTHAGPAVKSYKNKSETHPYEEFLFARVKSCIDKAFLNQFDGSLFYTDLVGDWNVNRRRNVNGEFVMAPNYDAPKDRTMCLLIVKDTEGLIRGIMVNYSCHPVTLSTTMQISAEFPGRINQLLEAEYYGSVCGFLQGAAGNMRPLISARGASFTPCSFDEVNRMASSMTAAIKTAVSKPSILPIDADFRAVSFVIKAPLDPISKETFEKMAQDTKGAMQDYYLDIVRRYDSLDDFFPIHAGLIRLKKDMIIAYMGGEVCYEVKQIVQRVLNEYTVIFLGYHEAITYIPSAKIITEGGYEGSRAQMMAGFKGSISKTIDQAIAEAFEKAKQSLL